MHLGGPTSPIPGCPYRLLNHGSYACVSRLVYEHVGADVQQFLAAILAMFFTIQFAAALGGLKSQTTGAL